MEKEIKALKEVYLNLWFRGMLFAFLGILNMLYIVIFISDMYKGEAVSWITFINVVSVIVLSRSSVLLQNERRIIFAKIRGNI